MPILEFRNLYKYFGKKLVLEDISFSINRGQVITVIGPNGAGKTTLAKIALDIEKPSSGLVIKKDKISIAYVPQTFALNPSLPLDVRSFLEIFSGWKVKNSYQDVIRLSSLDLSLDDSIQTLSGGQMQQLLISAAVLRAPDLLIVDEPLQALDVTAQENFYNTLEIVRQKYNAAILMISHDLLTVMQKSSEVICINRHICCRGQDITKENLESFGLKSIGLYRHKHDHIH